MDEVCNISNKYQPPKKLAKYQYFYKENFISLLHFWKKLALHRKRFSKHLLFAAFSLFITVREVCNISKKLWLRNKSTKEIFYTRHPTPLLHFKQKFAPSVVETIRNNNFLPHFYQLARWTIFQINTNILVIYHNINIFIQETLYPPVISKNSWCSPSQTFFETSTFYHIFTIFNIEGGLQYFTYILTS